MKIFKTLGLGLLGLLLSMPALAANHYIRSGATGTGADWTNACPGFSGSCAVSSLVRGDTYYIADGTYSAVTFNKAASGTTVITIKKATILDHGIATGWTNTFGDGTAAFTGEIDFETSNWVLDGQQGGGWADPKGLVTPFGLKASITSDDPVLRTGTVDNIVVRHIELAGSNNSSGGGSIAQDGVGLYGATHFTLSYYYIHDVGRCPFFISTQNFLAEYGFTGKYTSTAAAHAELASIWGFSIGSNGVVFRYNIFTHIEGTGGLIFDNEENPTGAGMQVYGNVFYRPLSDAWEINNGVIGGWTGGNGEQFHNVSVYNNSFINVSDSGNFSPLTDFPTKYSGNSAFNNLFYNSNSVDYSRFGSNGSNTVATSDPFVDSANLNFALKSATVAGTVLASPYNVDPLANVRGADGTWDRGAVEFTGVVTPPTPPAPPTNLRVAVN